LLILKHIYGLSSNGTISTRKALKSLNKDLFTEEKVKEYNDKLKKKRQLPLLFFFNLDL
jgi:hypothetical protein